MLLNDKAKTARFHGDLCIIQALIKEILLARGSASDASDKENFVVCFHGCMVYCIMAGL